MSEYRPKILIIEDQEQVREFVGHLLDSHDFSTVSACCGEEGLRLASEHNPDVILLDLGMPDIDGMEVLRRLREWSRTPVIVLSVRDAETDKVGALDEGADDYLTKPFSSKELLARIRVALRHVAQRNSDDETMVFESGDLRVNLSERRAYLDGEPLSLTATEYRLLSTMVGHAGKVLTYRFLLKEVWGPGYVDRSHYVRIYMARLRDKLGDDPGRQRYIVTETGVGYRLRGQSSDIS